MPDHPAPLNLHQPNVVGAVHSRDSLRRAARLKPDTVDILEIRLDLLLDSLPELRKILPTLRHPLLLTARHPREGGQGALSAAARRELLAEFLPWASAVDLELRSVGQLAKLRPLITQQGALLVLSHHDFRATPSPRQLRSLRSQAQRAGADIFKIATTPHSFTELGRMLALFPAPPKMPQSVMGMGDLGRISRLLFARAGSVLNYGYLDQALVSGQWPAALLKERLKELLGPSPYLDR